jgi:hypothetical protein
LNTTLTPHSIIHGDACFAYFNKIWGIPDGNDGKNAIHKKPPTVLRDVLIGPYLVVRVDGC